MKKIVTIIIVLMTMLTTLCGCKDKTEVLFLVPDGGTLLPVARLLTQEEQIDSKYTLKGDRVSGTEIEGKLSTQTPDIAIAPLNVASRAFNENSSYIVAAVVVWGNSYIIKNSGESGENLTLDSLENEIVYAFQESAVPGITLKAVLQKNNKDFSVITSPDERQDGVINLLFLASPAAVQTELNKENSTVKYAVLPEPNATAQTLSGTKHIAFDIQELWGESSYPQAVLVVKKSFLAAHRGFVDSFLQSLEASSAYCLNNAEAAATLAKENLQSAALPSVAALKAYISGNGQSVMKYAKIADVKNEVKAYLEVLFNSNANSVGGSVPSDEFYLV